MTMLLSAAGKRFPQQAETFLVRETADDAEDRHIGAFFEVKAFFEVPLCRRPCRSCPLR